MQDEDALNAELIDAYRRIVELGLTDQASGNVSVRVADGMLISCSGATAEDLTPDRVVKVRQDGSFAGRHQPSSEWRMHQAIYERHESAGAVVHTHSDYCVALSCNNLPLPGFHYMVGTLGGPDVPCVPYATYGTEQLAGDAAAALTDRVACLLGNHGAIARGETLGSAINRAERLETLCRHYVLARQLGEPDLLSDADWEAFFAQADQTAYRKRF